jgi:hypothetical protein
MADLKPTKARLELLQAIDNGAVTRVYPILPSPDYTEWDHGPGAGGKRYQKVTARVDELRQAGWVRVGDRIYDLYKSPRLYEVTDKGRAVLKEATDD